MQTQAQQPATKRPSLMVYGVMIIVACCLPALLLVSI
jgi:hypothetical protein